MLATLWPIADASTAQLMQILYRSRQQQHLSKAEALRQAQLVLLHGGKAQHAGTPVAPSAAAERSLKRVKTDEQNSTASTPFQTNPNAPFAHPYFWAPFILMGNWL